MMEIKQTAIQQLIEDIKIGTLSDHIDGVEYFSKDVVLELLENAKQMQKDALQECWHTAHQAGRFEGKGIAEDGWQTFEQYYKERYENGN